MILIGCHILSTKFAPHYVTTDVSYLTHPKAINSSWSDGILVNFTISSNKNQQQQPLNRFILFGEFLRNFISLVVNYGNNFLLQFNILMGLFFYLKF